MKKTIRLTEADLIRLVKRVVNEQEEGYEDFKDDINHFFPDADWAGDGDDSVIFIDNGMMTPYVGYYRPTRTVEASRLFMNELPYDEPSFYSYIKRWVEESLDVEVDTVNMIDGYAARARRTNKRPVNPEMSLSEFTKKYVSLQRTLFKKLDAPFNIEKSKMDAKETFEREPGKLKEIINKMSEILKFV